MLTNPPVCGKHQWPQNKVTFLEASGDLGPKEELGVFVRESAQLDKVVWVGFKLLRYAA